MDRQQKAKELFQKGYNCSQAVLGAFAQNYGMEFGDAMKVAAAMGGGIGRMRETCGALTGMLMAQGLLDGGFDSSDAQGKLRCYEAAEELASRFEKENGSMLCKELIGVERGEKPTPEEAARHKLICQGLVVSAVRILEDYFLSIEGRGKDSPSD
ncbi:MAG: C-GCAxxG-C-C family protein [Christensenellales bacterium]